MTRYEEMAMNAWPAIRSRIHEGCILRASNGYTKRANSANPLYARGTDYEALAIYAEAFFRGQNLPPTFKMIESDWYAGLDAFLDARGYGIVDPTHVMIQDLAGFAGAPDDRVVTTDYFYKEWTDSFIKCNSIPGKFVETAKAMLSLITVDIVVASIIDDNNIVACGYGAIDSGCVGLFDIVVDQSHRKKGYGRALVQTIVARAKERGANAGYLQVTDSNAIARKLYQSLGFREKYAYWYRIQSR